MKKLILISFAFFIIVALLVSLDYFEKESQVTVKVSMEGSFFRDTEFIQKREGQLKLKLSSKEAFMSDDGKLMDMRYLTILFPEKEFTVKSKRGLYYPESGDLFLTDGIEGFLKDYKVYGSEAYWSAKDKTLYSEKPLKIVSNRFSIEGNSGKANADLIELKKGVVAIVYSKK
ncbi:MAG: LPS export ABC transporter periplasmic protein LptC [Thermodesulfovibrio sp.]|nr:LPS export ABC transporter periplasmic protein LptC [Thermodesulfovibrio sp.]MDW7999287.1 LPS export ABC transporter periplasmic protein LptC [Thermodesulfovibrio sp.]